MREVFVLMETVDYEFTEICCCSFELEKCLDWIREHRFPNPEIDESLVITRRFSTMNVRPTGFKIQRTELYA